MTSNEPAASGAPESEQPANPDDATDVRTLAAQACEAVGFKIRWQPNVFRDQEHQPDQNLLFALPNGRYTRWINIGDVKARLINSVGITSAIALGEYEAFLYGETHEIEAQLGKTAAGLSRGRWLSSLPGVVVHERLRAPGEVSSDTELADDTKATPLDLWSLPFQSDPDQEWSASIGVASRQFSIYSSRPAGYLVNTLRLINTKVENHDDALALLEEVAGAILFETDLRYNIALSLVRQSPMARRRRIGPDGKPMRIPRVPRELSTEAPHLPRNSYPAKPLSLYWYARSAENMPLLQYLASYQILEYYFSTYYQRDALDRMRQELLDPRFSPQNDAHMLRLANLANPQGKSFGSERDQLRATIRACVSAGHLEDYLKEPSRQEFFAGTQTIKNVGRIDLKNKGTDLRDQVSDRIYDIRCRIVHSKSDSADRYAELLLPFSAEAESLIFDVDLIQYLAQRVLIHRAQPLRLDALRKSS